MGGKESRRGGFKNAEQKRDEKNEGCDKMAQLISVKKISFRGTDAVPRGFRDGTGRARKVGSQHFARVKITHDGPHGTRGAGNFPVESVAHNIPESVRA